MYYKTGIIRTNEKEFLASDKVISFTGTVAVEGVEADREGKKVVHKGSLMAASGKVVKITVSGDDAAVAFSEDPAGILLEAVDVTHGAQPGAFMVEGYVIGERLSLGVEYSAAVGEAIHEKLPEIKFKAAM